MNMPRIFEQITCRVIEKVRLALCIWLTITLLACASLPAEKLNVPDEKEVYIASSGSDKNNHIITPDGILTRNADSRNLERRTLQVGSSDEYPEAGSSTALISEQPISFSTKNAFGNKTAELNKESAQQRSMFLSSKEFFEGNNVSDRNFGSVINLNVKPNKNVRKTKTEPSAWLARSSNETSETVAHNYFTTSSAGDLRDSNLGNSRSQRDFSLSTKEIFQGASHGRDDQGNSQRKDNVTQSDNNTYRLNFNEAPISEVVSFILGDLLSYTYVMDDTVKGAITVYGNRDLNKDELLAVLESILASKNAALIQGSEQVYRVTSLENADLSLLPNHYAASGMQNIVYGYHTLVIQLEYISAESLKDVLKPFEESQLLFNYDFKRNMVLVSGSKINLQRIQNIIATFDVDWLADMSFGLFPLDFMDPISLQQQLVEILGPQLADAGELLRFVPVTHMDSLLVISPHSDYLYKAEQWIKRLDRERVYSFDLFRTYTIKYSDANTLAHRLNSVLHDHARVATSPSNNKTRPQTINPNITAGESIDGEEIDEKKGTPNILVGETPIDSKEKGNTGLVKIIPDADNNMLIIRASPTRHEEIQSLIKKLDVPPKQVLIEASIVEINLTDELQYGLRWFLERDFDTDSSRIKSRNISLNRDGTALSLLATKNSSDLSLQLLFDALATDSNIEVLSSPSIMALNNKAASINVGNSVPVSRRQSKSNLDVNAPIINEIEYRQTGVSLMITPQIKSKGLILMDIQQEVSAAINNSVGNGAASSLGQSFEQRKLNTSVAVHSGDTLVLGGLIREQDTIDSNLVPLLSSIPIVGKPLFKNKSKSKTRTELLVLLTPRIIEDRTIATKVTDELSSRMKHLQRALGNKVMDRQ